MPAKTQHTGTDAETIFRAAATSRWTRRGRLARIRERTLHEADPVALRFDLVGGFL